MAGRPDTALAFWGLCFGRLSTAPQTARGACRTASPVGRTAIFGSQPGPSRDLAAQKVTDLSSSVFILLHPSSSALMSPSTLARHLHVYCRSGLHRPAMRCAVRHGEFLIRHGGSSTSSTANIGCPEPVEGNHEQETAKCQGEPAVKPPCGHARRAERLYKTNPENSGFGKIWRNLHCPLYSKLFASNKLLALQTFRAPLPAECETNPFFGSLRATYLRTWSYGQDRTRCLSSAAQWARTATCQAGSG